MTATHDTTPRDTAAPRRTCIMLVPGFLGFQQLHTMEYFADVVEIIQRECAAAGVAADVRAVRTLPTSSLAARAARLAEVVAELPEDADVHLAGHSTGGLDSRLFVTPGASLPTTVDIETAASRVRSVVSVATPHYGTPLATYFTGVQGHRLMRLVSGVVTQILKRGKSSIGAAWELGKIVLLLDRITGLDGRVREALGAELSGKLSKLDERERTSVQQLLDEIGDDSSLLEHLTPISLELFNSAAGNRKTTRYGSVVAMAPPPKARRVMRFGFRPVEQLSHALYAASHRLTSAGTSRRRPPLTPEQRGRLQSGMGRLPDDADSDGLVPTLSQVWGEIVSAVSADHFDLMGWYGGTVARPRLNLFESASHFDAVVFEATWRAVARFALASGSGETDV
ncbi:MAG: triacylglycerol lipase [Myxococcota bacterium]